METEIDEGREVTRELLSVEEKEVVTREALQVDAVVVVVAIVTVDTDAKDDVFAGEED